MHQTSIASAAAEARRGGPEVLAQALQASRRDTLATHAAYERALPGLRVPLRADLNPPVWELGHIGWFQEYWVARNPQRHAGARADPQAPRGTPLRADADQLYNSSEVPHDIRWSLPLPDAERTRDELALQLEGTLNLLRTAASADDDALYFFRLVLLHEDMHHEAALYMARALGIATDDDPRWQPSRLPDPPTSPLTFEAGRWRLGSLANQGFAFDNELPAHEVAVGPTSIDAQVVRWEEYLPFVESGAWAQERWWSDAGLAWRAERGSSDAAPRYLRRAGAATWWECWRNGQWQPLRRDEAACHLSWHEAQAWCRWAGRRLPTEAEWERAALSRPDAFRWGDVWEWTASAFAPYPGFEAHPYRDYSAPWFDGRPVLRGASFMTQARMRDARYRNFFPAHRDDVAVGFRSCGM